jgi:hypothetical protein
VTKIPAKTTEHSQSGLDAWFDAPWPVFVTRMLALAVMFTALFIRLSLRFAALDDAEGEFAYTGQLLLQGIAPFREAANMKLPGTGAVYALVMAVFGQDPAGIHIGLALASLGASILLYFLGKRLFGELAGWTAAAAYALLSIGSGVLGTLANAEHFVVLPVLSAMLLLLRWRDTGSRRAVVATGLLYGLALVMKQSGGIFALFGAGFVLHHRRKALKAQDSWLDIAGFAAGLLLPMTLMCLWFWQAGVFAKFWFWTVTYGRAYAAIVPPAGALRILAVELPRLIEPFESLWLFAISGLILALLRAPKRAPGLRGAGLWVAFFLGVSLLALTPGLYFRLYYFVLLLPALALLCAAAMGFMAEYLRDSDRAIIFAAALFFAALPQRHFIFGIADGEWLRASAATDAFTVAGEYIRDHAVKDASIAVLGSEPQVYFYAKRHAATQYLFTYPFGEPQPFAAQMQDEFIAELDAARPEYIAALNMPAAWMYLPGYCKIGDATSCDIFRAKDRKPFVGQAWGWDYGAGAWVLRRGVSTRVFDWFATWGSRHYELIGIVDSLTAADTVSHFGAEAKTYHPTSQNYILLYHRKPD